MDISALSNLSNAAQSLSNLILVTPQQNLGYQPQPKPPFALPPKILFHYEGEQTAVLESDITDHYVENNSAIQDQIALRPTTITTQGFVGELNDVPPTILEGLKEFADRLTTISAYAPGVSVTARNAYNQALAAYQVGNSFANSAVAAWASITGTGGESVIDGQTITVNPLQTKQQEYFQQFFGYYSARALFTVQTPWAIFKNMAIKSLRAIQDAETRMITDFEVTFKQIRFANSFVVTSTTLGTLQNRAAEQNASVVNLGASVPPFSVKTLLGSVGKVLG